MHRPALRLDARDVRRTRELVDAVSRIDDRPVLRLVVPELASLLRAEGAFACRPSPTATGWQLDFAEAAHVSQVLIPRFRQFVAERPERWGAWDALHPEPEQRNKPIAFSSLTSLEKFADEAPFAQHVLAPARVARHDQFRVLFCDGPLLLAWVGVFTGTSDITPREHAIFHALVRPIRQRLVLERRLREAALHAQGLFAALEHLAAPAFLLRGDGSVAHANGMGRALVDERRVNVAARFRAARAGNDPELAVTALGVPGMPELFLAVFVKPLPELDARLARAERDWKLTRRQVEVLRELARGESNKGIAEKLRSAESTVEFHVTTLLRKSNAENRAALVARFWSSR